MEFIFKSYHPYTENEKCAETLTQGNGFYRNARFWHTIKNSKHVTIKLVNCVYDVNTYTHTNTFYNLTELRKLI